MLDGSVDFQKVNGFLGALLQVNAENLYRYKGLLAVDGDDYRHVFQASCFSSESNAFLLSPAISDFKFPV